MTSVVHLLLPHPPGLPTWAIHATWTPSCSHCWAWTHLQRISWTTGLWRVPTLDHCTSTCNLNMNEYDTSIGVANPWKFSLWKCIFMQFANVFTRERSPLYSTLIAKFVLSHRMLFLLLKSKRAKDSYESQKVLLKKIKSTISSRAAKFSGYRQQVCVGLAWCGMVVSKSEVVK